MMGKVSEKRNAGKTRSLGSMMRTNVRRTGILLFLLIMSILLLAGCGKKQPAGSATATSAVPATPKVTATPTATATPRVTATPTATATPKVTATPTPTAAPTEEAASSVDEKEAAETETLSVKKDGTYTSKEEVAAYIHEYGWLPDNYITKKDAEALGWISSKGNLWEVAPGKSIGGTRFGNYEGNLPEASGRKYYECDINYEGGYRGAERIVFSNDGLIFYTGDHYETWEQLY